MKAIILAALGNLQIDTVKSRSGDPKKRKTSSFDWILPAFKDNKINDIILIGGHDIEKFDQELLDARVLYNPDWAHTGMLGSLAIAAQELAGETIITYSDVVYDRNIITELVATKQDHDIIVALDSQWRHRYNRSATSLNEAEKAIANGQGKITRFTTDTDSESVLGEFAGLVYFSPKVAKVVGEIFAKYLNQAISFENKPHIKKAHVIDLLNHLMSLGHSIAHVDIKGRWAELEEVDDIIEFAFKHKADTLASLSPLVKDCKILPQVSFTLSQWQNDSETIIKKINKDFKDKKLVVRSSSEMEDQHQTSMAGAFESVLGVTNEEGALREAVNRVIKSYGQNIDAQRNHILVQPLLEGVSVSGVAFSCDLKTGAPYITVNYDYSGKTDTITSGTSADPRVTHVFRNADIKANPNASPRLKVLVNAIREIEQLTKLESLDIEFAFDNNDQLHIFQVRPIAAGHALANFYKHVPSDDVSSLKDNVAGYFANKPHMAGATTILADMPDWNPAEIIGIAPSPLTISLYSFLITDAAWRLAREQMGYRPVYGERLMHVVGGHPFIDVRNSFNSLLPCGLPGDLEHKLINHYLAYLKDHPELHDKVEFEILLTVLSPCYNDHLSRLALSGLSDSEIQSFKVSLAKFTKELLQGANEQITKLLTKVDALNLRRQKLVKQNNQINPAYTVAQLLDDCIDNGTIPFSILARYAFIATAFLKDFVKLGTLSQESVNLFLNSFSTVAGQFSTDFDRLKAGSISLKSFLDVYGHLRPGTYDISSPAYDEAPQTYFGSLVTSSENSKATKVSITSPLAENPAQNIFSPEEMSGITAELDKLGFNITANEFIRFAKLSIQGREYSKFIFTNNISTSLKYIKAFGDSLGMDVSRLSLVTIYEILDFMRVSPADAKSQLNLIIDTRKKEQDIAHQIILPNMITSTHDVDVVKFKIARPNFITQKKLNASSVYLRGATIDPTSLKNKIVLIENADPGFDWIFAHSIAGLVTKYGGAASHMAIRCAEFNLPAAIGCGEVLFDKLATGDRVLIDCANQTIQAL